MKLKFLFTVPIYFTNIYALPWYKKDAKRILSGTAWNSRNGYFNFGDEYLVQSIINKQKSEIDWLLHLKPLKTGEIRVTPMYEVDIIYANISTCLSRIKRK